ncbi:unnamed protein product [Caenorhabditis sp. 36 PRJEB53466]|nr:unnamed protein product [Caenorhabditis sp. 36 PRJEB53466]
MLRWLFPDNSTRSFDAPSETQSARDDRKNIGYGENYLLFDLVIGEIEMAVVRFETEKELKAEEERKAERRPDYSWLVSGNSHRARKQLSVHEKNRIENACERLKPCEWSKTIDTWKKKTQDPSSRDEIVEQFVIATHDTIQARKHEPTLGEVVRNITSGRSISFNSVRHADMPRNAPASARNVAELSFIELQEMV